MERHRADGQQTHYSSFSFLPSFRLISILRCEETQHRLLFFGLGSSHYRNWLIAFLVYFYVSEVVLVFTNVPGLGYIKRAGFKMFLANLNQSPPLSWLPNKATVFTAVPYFALGNQWQSECLPNNALRPARVWHWHNRHNAVKLTFPHGYVSTSLHRIGGRQRACSPVAGLLCLRPYTISFNVWQATAIQNRGKHIYISLSR